MLQPAHIAIVRLGAMGDVLHALPAVASLRQSFPAARISWIVAPRWRPLLAGNPAITDVVPFDRSSALALARSLHAIRGLRPDLALDLQGLLQSALVGRFARPRRLLGFAPRLLREPAAALFYAQRVHSHAAHVVERSLDLAAAAGATCRVWKCFIPQGTPEGELPSGPFILASPFAGWPAKQWPIDRYARLASLLAPFGLRLVVNVPAARTSELAGSSSFSIHTSSLSGLIDATRRATAVLGLDSGPLHLAAALNKPGVALFGPTDPARNGPYGSSFRVLRSPSAVTTYRRRPVSATSMAALTAEEVARELLALPALAAVAQVASSS